MTKKLTISFEGKTCSIAAPVVYLRALAEWYSEQSFEITDAMPAWFAELLDEVLDQADVVYPHNGMAFPFDWPEVG